MDKFEAHKRDMHNKVAKDHGIVIHEVSEPKNGKVSFHISAPNLIDDKLAAIQTDLGWNPDGYGKSVADRTICVADKRFHYRWFCHTSCD